ncbi:hypothetical protein [Rhodococcus sp. ACS1]|uniref:hypothetical protein n=1 Tax=Rhodococcus sp. ACS1 TaxID=2028570 RepID=UPI001C531BBC|nr:hypothetical protein [Rhodococcus sp. ACS1]
MLGHRLTPQVARPDALEIGVALALHTGERRSAEQRLDVGDIRGEQVTLPHCARTVAIAGEDEVAGGLVADHSPGAPDRLDHRIGVIGERWIIEIEIDGRYVYGDVVHCFLFLLSIRITVRGTRAAVLSVSGFPYVLLELFEIWRGVCNNTSSSRETCVTPL